MAEPKHQRIEPRTGPKSKHRTLIMGMAPPDNVSNWESQGLPGGNAPSSREKEPTPSGGQALKRALATFNPGVETGSSDKLAMSDDDISKALATFVPIEADNVGTSSLRTGIFLPKEGIPEEAESIASVHPEATPEREEEPSLPTVDVSIEDTDFEEIVTGDEDSIIEAAWLPKASLVRPLVRLHIALRAMVSRAPKRATWIGDRSVALFNRSVSWCKIVLADSRKWVVERLGKRPRKATRTMDYIRALALKSRRNYRVLALMVGIIIIGACFSLVGIFLFAGKERIPEQSPPAKSDGSRALSVDVAEHQSASVAPSLPAKERSEAPEAGRDQASKNAATQETAPNATAGTSIPHKSQDTVHIRLVGLPETASVLVNGKAAELPLVVSRSQQPIKIEARAPGYETAVKRVVPGQDKTVKIQMEQGGGAIGTESDEESVQQKRLASNPFRS